MSTEDELRQCRNGKKLLKKRVDELESELATLKSSPLFDRLTTRGVLIEKIAAELSRAYAKHGKQMWGRHEFYGVLTEEYRELETAIFTDEPQDRVIAELVQVAAMCFRYFETGDRYRGSHLVSRAS